MLMRKLLLGLPVVAAALGAMAVTPTPALADNDHAPPWSQQWRHDHHPQRHGPDDHPWWAQGRDGDHARWDQGDHRQVSDRRDHKDYRYADGRDHAAAPRWAPRPWWSHR